MHSLINGNITFKVRKSLLKSKNLFFNNILDCHIKMLRISPKFTLKEKIPQKMMFNHVAKLSIEYCLRIIMRTYKFGYFYPLKGIKDYD